MTLYITHTIHHTFMTSREHYNRYTWHHCSIPCTVTSLLDVSVTPWTNYIMYAIHHILIVYIHSTMIQNVNYITYLSAWKWLLLFLLSTMSQVTTAVIDDACIVFCVNFTPYIQQMPWHHVHIAWHTLIVSYTISALQKYLLRHISITSYTHCCHHIQHQLQCTM